MVSRESVLVVDDDLALRDGIAETLSSRGYTPIAVGTAQEALDHIARDKPPVALIDLKLGRASGMDIVRVIEERDWPTECIIITGSVSGRTAIEALNLGVHGYVQKPFDPEQLMMLIQDAVEKRRVEETTRDRTVELEQMERALQRSREAMAHSHRLSLALSCASEAVQRARTPEEIYCTVLNEVVYLDCHALVLTLREDRHHLTLSYITPKSPLLRAAEELAGGSAVGLQSLIGSDVFNVAVDPGGFYDGLIEKSETVFVDRMAQRLLEDVPDLVDGLDPQTTSALAAERGIYAPLIVNGETEGVLVVTGATLSRDDAPAVTTFANQIAIALERARLYQETRESEERLRAMSASAQDAIVVTDEEGRVTFWNEAAERIFGYAKPDALGEKVHSLVAPQRYHDDYRRFFERPKETDREPPVGTTFELVAMRQGGTEFPAEVSVSTAMLRGRVHVIGIIRDITERKEAEEALRQYAAELEASNEELDAFAHTVAHDLKNPLGNLMSSAEILLESYTELSEDQRQLCLRSISRGSERMNNIINALLLLASVRKIEEIAVEPLDMAQIVGQACERLRTLVDEHDAEIILPETWPEALGYAPWMEEVWVNYVSNAVKYGGRSPRVELGAVVESASSVRFWVRDNGRGISPEDQARLFTPFTRLNQIQVKGYGLGLSIVRRIVEKLGGRVAVESQVGQGSVFSFVLPAVSPGA